MKISRDWATPLTAGAFVFIATTGVLMFFRIDKGFNHLAHEWLGWVLLAGVGMHITSNFAGFKRHLGGRLGQAFLGVFLVVLALSFIKPGGEKLPGWAPTVQALAIVPIKELPAVAKIDVDEISTKLQRAGFTVTSQEQTIRDLAGPNLKQQVRALNTVFE